MPNFVGGFVVDIKLKDLRYLVAVADSRHFGRAADRCFVSQPTLSAQLKKLEQYLGVQLIERQPNNVSLTEAGEQIVARARRILEASEEVVTLARAHRDPLAGRLRVAFIPTIGPYLLPRVSQAIRKSLPRLELRLYEYQTAPMLEKLQVGEIDVGILALPVELEGLEARELYAEQFILAMPDRHRLAKRDTVRTDDLLGETLLLLEDGHCLRDQALEVCSRVGVEEKQDFRATSLETLRQMVATGAGVTLLPELASRGAYGNARGVEIRPFAKPAPVRHVGAVWRKTTARQPAIDALCKLIAEHAK
jgi:LysR family transcriptional regulator, hydrogen peroxide-inducible genes activator